MSVIGEQIKKYRVERGITQEQLGQLVGVTTQAVSRWERGGTPDAEILPQLARVLGVNIDTLFGRGEQSFAIMLAKRLSQLPQDEAYRYAFNICWAIEIGLFGNPSMLEDFMNRHIESSVFEDGKKTDYYAKLIHDSGMATVRMSPDLNHFFLMVEPQGSLKDQLSDPEELRKVFEMFADKKLLKIIFFLHTVPDMNVATSLISKSTGLSLQETDRCMDKFCDRNLVLRSVIATADGNVNTYMFRRETFAVPLLCLADELARKDLRPFLGDYKRKKPFF